MYFKKSINNKWMVGIGIAVIGAVIAGIILYWVLGEGDIGNSQENINSFFDKSPQCVGENCQQTINYNQINQEVESIYVSPAKKLIKTNMSDYSFPFKIVNEKSEDFNDVGLIYIVPADYGIYRVMIKPKDETEQIKKYNNSLQIMLPCFGWQDGDNYLGVCDIESVYKLETKEYTITVNTRNYSKDFFIEFGLIDLAQQPQLKEIFRGFGVE